MITRYALPFALLALLPAQRLLAQCQPTFANGCFGWNTMSVSGGGLNWAIGANACGTYDYTANSASATAGLPLALSVTNGAWCGCAVWVDLDNNGDFAVSENLYYVYVGGTPSYTYDFSITVPSGTASGTYKMRIISPWGSDGVSAGANGYGACGSFQYGNFVEFNLNVSGSNSIEETEGSGFDLSPNPTNGAVTISAANAIGSVDVIDARGRVMLSHRGIGDRHSMDTQGWPAGVYTVRMRDARGTTLRRLMVE